MPVKNQSEYDSKKPPTVKKPKPSAKIKKTGGGSPWRRLTLKTIAKT